MLFRSVSQSRYKTKAVLDAEIAAVKPYCKGVSLFRYGISNFDNTPIPVQTVPTYPAIDKTIQQKLKDLGYYTGTVDGKQGPYTTAAIKAFQTANGLVADGIVGPITKAKLFPISYPAGFTETNGLKLYRQTTGYTCGPSSLKMALSYRDWETDRKSTRLNSSHRSLSRMPSSA